MENKLRKMFDFQKFSKNPELDAVVRGVEERYQVGDQGTLIPEDELRNVAGGQMAPELEIRIGAKKKRKSSPCPENDEDTDA